MSNIEKFKSGGLATKDQFLNQFSPGKCLRIFQKADTPALTRSSGAPTLASIKKNYTEDFLIAYIAVWIVNLNDFVNASRKMNPPQIEETATLIFQDYYYLNLADINLVFKKIKKGEFGQLYTELDGVKILSWFEKYANERAKTAADQETSFSDRYTDDFERTSNRENEKTKNKQAVGLYIQELKKKEISMTDTLSYKPLSKLNPDSNEKTVYIPAQVKKLKKIATLYVTDLPFSAESAVKAKLPVIGYKGISNQYSDTLKQLEPDFTQFVQKKKVHTIVLLYNTDAVEPYFAPGEEKGSGQTAFQSFLCR